jgi:hypothetical protein
MTRDRFFLIVSFCVYSLLLSSCAQHSVNSRQMNQVSTQGGLSATEISSSPKKIVDSSLAPYRQEMKTFIEEAKDLLSPEFQHVSITVKKVASNDSPYEDKTLIRVGDLKSDMSENEKPLSDSSLHTCSLIIDQLSEMLKSELRYTIQFNKKMTEKHCKRQFDRYFELMGKIPGGLNQQRVFWSVK